MDCTSVVSVTADSQIARVILKLRGKFSKTLAIRENGATIRIVKTEHRLKPRLELAKARRVLGVSRCTAGQAIGKTGGTIQYYEQGGGREFAASATAIRDLCRWYQQRATELGYDPAEFHESVLCPGEFPKPMKEVAA